MQNTLKMRFTVRKAILKKNGVRRREEEGVAGQLFANTPERSEYSVT